MKIGRNDSCWCGSGLKYKRCHLNRTSQAPVTAAEVVKNLSQARDHRYCSCPENWKNDCKGQIVRAHSLSRRSALGTVTENGHVYSLAPNWNRAFHQNDFSGHLISGRKASTFTGFCEKHDSEIFAEIDRDEFEGTTKQSALVGYRTLARELFTKISQIRSFEGGKALDRGRSSPDQFMIQTFFSTASDSGNIALRELKEIKNELDTALQNNDFGSFEFLNLFFDAPPILVGAGATNPTHDLRARLIQDLSRLDTVSQNLFLSLLPAKAGFCLSLMWRRSDHLINNFVRDIESREIRCGTAYATMLAYIENCFLKPSAWNAMPQSIKRALHQLAWTGVADDNYEYLPAYIETLELEYPAAPLKIVRN